MYQADRYLQSVITPAAVKSFTLTAPIASTLTLALNKDASDNYYSAVVSLGDAVGGINRGFFSWATVKLYYSVFYALRSLMALDGHCLFHIGRKPKWIRTIPGAQPVKAGNNTHLAVLSWFERNYSSHILLSQAIETDPPLLWLYAKRVTANYTNSGFGEPVVPEHFERIVSVGTRRAIEAYLSDTSFSYAFDPDHSMLAFPLKTLEFVRQKLIASGLHLEEERSRFLPTVAFRDKQGPISKLQTFLMAKS